MEICVEKTEACLDPVTDATHVLRIDAEKKTVIVHLFLVRTFPTQLFQEVMKHACILYLCGNRYH